MKKSPGLIRKILSTRSSVEPGESFRIIVKTRSSAPERPILVCIDGAPGADQILQLHGRVGPRRITITASASDGETESRELEIALTEATPCRRFPVILVGKDIESRHGVVCRVGNAAALGIEGALCEWKIGGVRAQSHGPQATLDLTDLLDADTVHQTLTVELTVRRGHSPDDVASRSFTLLNDYAQMKHHKHLLQPPVRYDFVARRDGDRLLALCEVRNLERIPLRISSRQIEYLYDDPERVSVPGPETEMETLIIEPKSRREFDCSIPLSALPKDAFGFAWHFHGRSEAGHDATFSAYFEHVTPKAQLRRVSNKRIAAALGDMRRLCRNRERTAFRLSEAEAYLHEQGLSLFVPKARDAAAPQGGHVANRRLRHARVDVDPLDDLRVFGDQREGDECLPDQEPAHADLACQLTEEWAWVYIPARIMNGRKGDTVLSPSGTSGPVSLVLHNVAPPQNYAHTGIMVQNFYALRHSCGSDDWLGDPDTLVGESPVSDDRGTDGIDPERLKYFWPGTITQSAREAVEGSFLLDPDGHTDKNGQVKKFRISAFDLYPKENPGYGNIVIEVPRVVSPPKRVESNLPKIREMLHAVAERAKQIEGHYRFYGYTDSAIALDTAYRAPIRAGWWASGTVPTMCSSFIWLAAKTTPEFDIRLEGPETFLRVRDLEADDVAIPSGAQVPRADVDNRTRDGLYFYTAEERQQAGRALYTMYYDKVRAMSGFLGTLFTDAPDDVASQVCNTFAFDWSGEDADGVHAKNSDRWEDEPSIGRAVSPADILFWDEPRQVGEEIHGLYGYSEPLVYRPARLEWRRISRWKKVGRSGTVRGIVTRRGAPQPQAHVLIGGKDTLSNDKGEFSLSVPAGDYLAEAHVFADGFVWNGATPLNVPAGGTTDTRIELKEPPDWFREVEIYGTMAFKDEENVGSDEFKSFGKLFTPLYRIGAFSTFADGGWSERMGGEIRGELYFRMDWQMDSSIRLYCHLKLFEGTSEDTDDLDGEMKQTVIIAKDAVNQEVRMKVTNTDERDDDHVDLVLRVTNRRQP
jgi:hypothetical protein